MNFSSIQIMIVFMFDQIQSETNPYGGLKVHNMHPDI